MKVNYEQELQMDGNAYFCGNCGLKSGMYGHSRLEGFACKSDPTQVKLMQEALDKYWQKTQD